MNSTIPTLNEINAKAENILIQELGIANTLRFFNQFNQGNGNYTEERHQWLDSLSLDEIVKDIIENRKSAD